MHPDRGARFLAPWSRGVAPTTRGSGIACDPATPLGCRTHCLTGKCDTLTGSYIFHGILFPGSSALRASTPGLKSDDPSGASPLRDRQAGTSGDITAWQAERHLEEVRSARPGWSTGSDLRGVRYATLLCLHCSRDDYRSAWQGGDSHLLQE